MANRLKVKKATERASGAPMASKSGERSISRGAHPAAEVGIVVRGDQVYSICVDWPLLIFDCVQWALYIKNQCEEEAQTSEDYGDKEFARAERQKAVEIGRWLDTRQGFSEDFLLAMRQITYPHQVDEGAWNAYVDKLLQNTLPMTEDEEPHFLLLADSRKLYTTKKMRTIASFTGNVADGEVISQEELTALVAEVKTPPNDDGDNLGIYFTL